MLEEVQRRAPPAVEQLHVVGLGVQRVLQGEVGHQLVQLGQARFGQRGLVMQRAAQLGQVLAQLGVGITQQPGERTQAARHGLGRVAEDVQHGGVSFRAQMSALMGMVRRFSLPNRLVSPTPSEQPLPKLKPQPPRTLNAFSAYSRWALGITNRSS